MIEPWTMDKAILVGLETCKASDRFIFYFTQSYNIGLLFMIETSVFGRRTMVLDWVISENKWV